MKPAPKVTVPLAGISFLSGSERCAYTVAFLFSTRRLHRAPSQPSKLRARIREWVELARVWIALDDPFTRSYIDCALWSSTGDDGLPLDRTHTAFSLSAQAVKRILADCCDFKSLHGESFKEDPERAGADFWLTRNRHGAGFWDGDWPEEVGDKLTEASHMLGSCDLYVGADGKLYL